MQTSNPSGSLIGRVIGVLGAIVVIGFTAFLGVFVFLALLGLAAVGAVVFAVRLWWLRRQLRQAAERAQARHQRQQSAAGGRVIEGEYRREEGRRQD
ncbi:hypothetical protein ACN2MM_03715 [Alkalilimnicola ehrlichii MLHE-1]|nr:hypothetical protein [Alkalilimnicola ehrlichii]